MGYKNPILAEIYVELNLSGEGLGSAFVEMVGLLKKHDLTAVELAPIKQLSINALNPSDPTITHENLPRVRVWNSQKTKLVQLSKQQIVINLVGLYPGWATFKQLFDNVLNELRQQNAIAIESMLLATIDKATVPSQNFQISDYLNTAGGIIPSYFNGSKEPADIILGKGVAKLNGRNRQFQVSWVPRGPHFEIAIQAKLQNMLNPADQVGVVLETLHDEAVNDFEKMITDKMRNDVMKGLA